MPSCVAIGCRNRTSKKIMGITFHRFPVNPVLRAAWVKAVRRKDWEPSKCSTLCSEHFSKDQFDTTSLSCVRLKNSAVPNIFDSITSCPQKERNIVGRGSWRANLKVLDEGIYPAEGATILCRCIVPEKVDLKHFEGLPSECCIKRTHRNSSSSQLTSIMKQLSLAHQQIKGLIQCLKKREQEHVDLHMERGNPLVRNMHAIKKDAVDGDMGAIVLLNQIASYVPHPQE